MKRTKSTSDESQYYSIAAVMTDAGVPMAHSTARNHVIRAVGKIVKNVSGRSYSERELIAIAIRPEVQEAVGEVIGQMLEKDR
mgnify:CR=1 FL=1